MIEAWKWIRGYEGIYMISRSGAIKSFRKHKDGYILSNRNSKGDYLRINLYDRNGRRESTSIHLVVAKTFIGEIPKGYQVHHIDGNKQNNAVSNLEIIHPVAHRQETKKAHPQIESGMVNYNRFVRPKAVFQYSLDGKFIASYPNAKEAGIATGICSRNILQVASKTPYGNNGKIRSQAGGYVWKFENERSCCPFEI